MTYLLYRLTRISPFSFNTLLIDGIYENAVILDYVGSFRMEVIRTHFTEAYYFSVPDEYRVETIASREPFGFSSPFSEIIELPFVFRYRRTMSC